MKNTEMMREGHDEDVKTRCQEVKTVFWQCFIVLYPGHRHFAFPVDLAWPQVKCGEGSRTFNQNFGHSRGTRCHLEPEGDCSVDENLKSLDLEYVRLETLSLAPFSTCCSLTSCFLGSRISLEQKWWKQWMNSKHLSIYKHTHTAISHISYDVSRGHKRSFFVDAGLLRTATCCWTVATPWILLLCWASAKRQMRKRPPSKGKPNKAFGSRVSETNFHFKYLPPLPLLLKYIFIYD